MNVTYEHKAAMTFIGFSTSIRPEEGYQKCPEFWNKEYAQKYERLWQTMKPETAMEKAILENGVGLFAICDEKEGSFEYWIAGLYKGGQVPEGLKLYPFPESDWAQFSAKGPLPGSGRQCSRKPRWKKQSLKTASECLPSAMRRKAPSNTGSPGFTKAARCLTD